MSLTRSSKLYYSSVTSAIYQIVSIVCGLVLPKLILETYGSDCNGVVSSITKFFQVFSILQIGIQGATRVALYKTLAAKDIEGTSGIMNANIKYYRKISIWLILYIIILAYMMPQFMTYDMDVNEVCVLVLIIGGGNFIQYFYGNAYKALITADQSVYIINILQTITVLLNTFLCLEVIWHDGSFILAMLCSSIVYALIPISIFAYVKYKYKLSKSVEPNSDALKGRWDVLANSLANIVHENVDIVVITAFCNAVEVSVYVVYSLVSSGLTRLMLVFTSGAEAAFGDMYAKKENLELNRNFKTYEYMMFCIAGILSGCMYSLILPFIELYTINVNDAQYVRPEFAISLSLALLTMSVRMPYVMMVQAAGHYKQTKVGSFVEAGLNIFLSLWFIQIWGITGVVVATIIANSFRTLQYGVYTYCNVIQASIVNFVQKLVWLFITMAFAIIASRSVIDYFNTNWYNWIICALLCGLVHIIVFVFSSFVFYKEELLIISKRFITKKTMVSKKRKIIVFAQSNVGGAERMAVTVTKSLNIDDFQLKYFLVGMEKHSEHPLKCFIPNHWEVHTINQCGSLLLLSWMAWTIIKERPDVVFSSTLYINNKLLLISKLFPLAKFYVRCENYLYTYNAHQKSLIAKLYPRASCIIAQTEEMKQELVDQMHIQEEKIVVFHNPIDVQTIDKKISGSENPFPDINHVNYVASGRFVYQKGFDMLVKAFAKVRTHQPNAELYIVGKNDGNCSECYDQVLKESESLGISTHVHFVGFQNNPYKYVKYADCFVLSSRWEGLPNVLIESLYLGTPVAAFKCIPIIERIVNDKYDGYLAEKDNLDSLSEAMINASKLGRVVSTYKSARIEDFHQLLLFDRKPVSGGVTLSLRIKRILKQFWIVKKITSLRDEYNNKRLYELRQPYFDDIKKHLPSNVTIISSNCFAGRIMQDLNMQYNSPTLGLWFTPDSFSLFCSDLHRYLKSNINFSYHSKYKLGEQKRLNWRDHPYPIGNIENEIEIHFLHYCSFDEAVDKWKRRSTRVNFDNMLLIGMEQNGCTEEDIKRFDSIPYPAKIYFTSRPYPYKSVIFVKEFEGKGHVGDPYRQGYIFYKYLLEWLGSNSRLIGKY